MFIKAEDGDVYNLAQLAKLRIGERQQEENSTAEEDSPKRKRFYLEAFSVSYYAHSGPFGRSSSTLANFDTREEAEAALDMIVAKAGGIDATNPKKQWELD